MQVKKVRNFCNRNNHKGFISTQECYNLVKMNQSLHDLFILFFATEERDSISKQKASLQQLKFKKYFFYHRQLENDD